MSGLVTMLPYPEVQCSTHLKRPLSFVLMFKVDEFMVQPRSIVEVNLNCPLAASRWEIAASRTSQRADRALEPSTKVYETSESARQ